MNFSESPIEKYLNNIEKLKTLSNLTYPPETSADDVLCGLKAAREQAVEIRRENAALLADPVLGFGLQASDMNAGQAEMLKEFASRLAKFAVHKDLGLFYQIHQQLLAYAEYMHDQSMTIEEHYYCGLALYYIRTPFDDLKMDQYEDELLMHFKANAALMPQITSIEDHTAQLFILRSLGNVRLGYSLYTDRYPFELYNARPGDRERYISEQHAVIDAFFDPSLEKAMPYISWDALRFAICSGSMVMLSYLRDTDDEAEAQYIYERAQYIEKHLEQTENTKDRFVKPRFAYYFSAARFHCGKMTIDQLLDTIFHAVESADPNDFSLDGNYLNLDLSSYALAYWGRYSRDEKWRSHIDAARRHGQEYLQAMTDYDSAQLTAAYLIHQMQLNYSLHLHSDATYMFKNLLILDKPSYLHCYIVSELARAIGSWLYSHHPEAFTDLKEYMTEHGQPDTQAFLLEMIRMSGLYSDVGMLSVLSVARMYSRPFTPEELETLHLHAYAGYITLCLHPDTEIYATAALGHHRWYNGQGGYPESYDQRKDKSAFAVNIVSAAAYLENVTDPLTIRMIDPISADEAVRKIQSLAGTQFDPLVADALQNANLQQRLQTILERGRKAAYVRTYRRPSAGEQ